MSYILDALRRADADRERERGAVPGLHTQALAETSADTSPLPGLRRWLWPAVGLGSTLFVVLAGWAWFAEPAPAVLTAPAPAVATVPPPVAAVPEVAAMAPVARVTPAARSAAVRPPVVEPVRPTPKPATARTPAVALASATASATASANSTAPARVASLAELPEEARRGLPALAFGGSIYASTPANRLLIVNGQLVHEGDSLGAGVTLEQIKPKAAVINIRGQRYEVGY